MNKDVKVYKWVRFFYWTILSAFVLLGVFFSPTSGQFFLGAAIFVVISLFVCLVKCPHCNQCVGYRSFGLLAVMWPFGGWCLSCQRKLFGKAASSSSSNPLNEAGRRKDGNA
ncbi:hypothetical protein [Xanthomonas vasicola]|uniref:hypothetical protein n=1 Tax=Xanthomonas vasicola TaxID=56459 RepID=UPI001008ED0D|nr:hypothetical protein [Xanthomonas vasicola]